MRALLKRIKMPPDAATAPVAAKALGLHLAGYTYVGIAAELGCTPGEAYDLVRQALPADKTKPKGFVLPRMRSDRD
jgi:hypothetical protein